MEVTEARPLSGCSHLKQYKSTKGNNDYEFLAGNLVFPHSEKNYFDWLKIFTSKCSEHNCFSNYRLHVCLHCVKVLCHDKHLRAHYKASCHNFAIEISFANCYCFICDDYVYDDDFLSIADSRRQYSNLSLGFQYTPVTDIPLYKADISFQLSTFIDLPCKRLKPSSYLGLRGLMNHGTTCFMNSILQAFAHIPMMRNYIMSNQHQCKNKHNCFLCQMERLFQEFYSGETGPICLVKLVPLVWERASHLAGNVMHDAHEFFIAALNLIHEDCGDSESKHCSCVSHKMFTGHLQSNLVCKKCKHISTTMEPFFDISLNLMYKADSPDQTLSVEECLDLFTQSERLESECTKCNSKGTCTKQYTFQELPHVLILHLKRFETFKSEVSSRTSLKVEKVFSIVTFPSILDITKFRSDYDSDTISEEDPPNMIYLADNRYKLYAVINHTGPSPNSGHYTAYILFQGNWFKCDDTKITRATEEDVLNSEAYLLVYEKVCLEYS